MNLEIKCLEGGMITVAEAAKLFPEKKKKHWQMREKNLERKHGTKPGMFELVIFVIEGREAFKKQMGSEESYYDMLRTIVADIEPSAMVSGVSGELSPIHRAINTFDATLIEIIATASPPEAINVKVNGSEGYSGAFLVCYVISHPNLHPLSTIKAILAKCDKDSLEDALKIHAVRYPNNPRQRAISQAVNDRFRAVTGRKSGFSGLFSLLGLGGKPAVQPSKAMVASGNLSQGAKAAVPSATGSSGVEAVAAKAPA